MTKPTVVYVIGMGRSGTSLTGQMLDKAGAYFGDPDILVPASDMNKRGNFEHSILSTINITLLKDLFGVTWLFFGGLPNHWWEWEKVKPFEDEAVKYLIPEIEKAKDLGRPFVFKDPRVTRLIPLWERACERAGGGQPAYVFCWRHPAEVYLSLHPRDPLLRPSRSVEHFHAANHPELHRDDTYAIWLEYLMDAFPLMLDGRVRVVLNYGDWFVAGKAKPMADALTRAAGLLEMSNEQIAEVLDPALRTYSQLGDGDVSLQEQR